MKREKKSIDGMLRLVLTLLVVLLSTPFAYAQAGHGDHATDDTHQQNFYQQEPRIGLCQFVYS